MSPVVPLCPVTGNQGRKRWWLEPVACMCLAVGTSCRCLCGGRGRLQTHNVGPGPMTGSLQLRDPGCPCVSPLAAQSSPRCVHSMCIKQAACKCTVCVWQREASQVVHACVWYSRTTEAWTGCQCCSRALAGGGWRVRSRKGGIRLVGISECKSMSGESWEICRGSQSCASSWFCPGWSRSLCVEIVIVWLLQVAPAFPSGSRLRVLALPVCVGCCRCR